MDTTPAPSSRPGTGLRARARLAALTLLVATIPIALGAWLVASNLGGRERERADADLQRSLRSAGAEFASTVAAADRDARLLSARPEVQKAVLRADRRAAAAIARSSPRAVLFARGRRLAGSARDDSLVRSVTVVGPGGRVAGRVGVAVPVDGPMLARLQRGVAAPLLLAREGRVTAGPFGSFEVARAPTGAAATIDIGSRRYRAVSMPLSGGVELIAATPAAEVEAAAAARTRDVALAALATLLTILVAAEAFVPVLRRRSAPVDEEESLELLGSALAAAHDRDALLPIILETVVEATGAVGGILLENGEEIARVGQAPSLTRPLSLRLAGENGSAAVVLLYPPAPGFTRKERRRAEWFAAQASIAVENTRRHAITAIEAVTDALTGLANRRRFLAQLAAEAGRRARSGQSVAVIVADLDDFKQINDRHGHEAGDDVLRAFARLLRGTVREVDVAARLGGEEFAVLLPETDADGAAAIADRLRVRLEGLRLVAPDGSALSVTASFGVASSPPVEGVEDLPAAADAALYRAKREGKNRVIGAAL